MTFTLTSTAFADGERIPDRHASLGEDISPPLAWSGAPSGVRSFALIVEDLDAPHVAWQQWALCDIPASQSALAEDFPQKARIGPIRQCINEFHGLGYRGPCPLRGQGTHRYRFRLLALAVERLDLAEGPGGRDVAAVAQGHVLAEAILAGTYSRD